MNIQARMTTMQMAVFQVLEQHDKPMSAYDILDALRGSNARLAPTTIYRALNALCARGQTYRIESLKAFAVKRSSAPSDAVILSICDGCGTVEEIADAGLLQHVEQSARRSGFEATRHVVELHGRCGACAMQEART